MSKKVPSPRSTRDGASPGRARGGASAKRRAKPAATAAGATVTSRGPSKSLEPTVRLQKVLAEAGVASRRRAEELILAGKVKVNGVVVRELGTKVDPQRDRVVVAGEIARSEPKVYYLLNKPDGIVCSAEGQTDDRGRPTVLSLLQGVHERIYPVGRLDFHTRGLLLLTNDGELADLLAHPRNKVLKVYHAKFQGRLERAALEALAKGVQLDDGVKTKPAEIAIIKETDTNTWVEIGLRQGLNRQVRRMGEAIGHPVLKLIRVGLGDLDVDDLEEGQYRRLSRTEIETLRAYAQFGRDGAAKATSAPAAGAPAAPTPRGRTTSDGTRPAAIGESRRRTAADAERGARAASSAAEPRAARSPARPPRNRGGDALPDRVDRPSDLAPRGRHPRVEPASTEGAGARPRRGAERGAKPRGAARGQAAQPTRNTAISGGATGKSEGMGIGKGAGSGIGKAAGSGKGKGADAGRAGSDERPSKASATSPAPSPPDRRPRARGAGDAGRDRAAPARGKRLRER